DGPNMVKKVRPNIITICSTIFIQTQALFTLYLFDVIDVGLNLITFVWVLIIGHNTIITMIVNFVITALNIAQIGTMHHCTIREQSNTYKLPVISAVSPQDWSGVYHIQGSNVWTHTHLSNRRKASKQFSNFLKQRVVAKLDCANQKYHH
ncbi:hypothetical protein ACJX0J_038450, partial [Zea mays]